MAGRGNQTLRYQCQEDLEISGTGQFQQEMTVVSQAPLHQEILHYTQKQGITCNTCQDEFFQLGQHADQLALCNHLCQHTHFKLY